MNNKELIDKLGVRAGLLNYIDNETPREYFLCPWIDRENLETLAELIVQECINVIQRRHMGDNNREDAEVRRCIVDLKQHFGIEE